MFNLRLVTLLLLPAVITAIVVGGCDKKDDNPLGPNGPLDSKLIAVWYNEADIDGMEITSNGTIKPLAVGQDGKLGYADVALWSGTISASDGKFKATQKFTFFELTARETTIVLEGTYVLANSDTKATFYTETVNGVTGRDTSIFVKKAIGDVIVVYPPPVGASVTLSFQSNNYTFNNADVMMNGAKLYFQATNATYPNSNLVVQATRTVGAHPLPMDGSINILLSGTQYIGMSGSVTITSITGKNTIGTFSGKVVLPTDPLTQIDASGTFNVTLP